ncbi:MAG: N-acetylmuramoyl-L-alanine amidase, partial [Myxococcales bacterium]|nr:N-acetylmuramoyl-L-alanine amidase [Myxococcales bacterium]
FASRPPSGDGGARLSLPLRGVQRIVVDPGHGGRDPGAIGIGRVHEKDVNLRLAKRLASELRGEGFEVVLTREDDRYLDLEERTALAESADGDLFVSVHANSSPRVDTRGIEIYYLDDEHERHSLDVAARESGVPRSELDSLQRTLAKLRIGETGLHSETLARFVHEDVMDGLATDRRTRDMPDLGVKKGPFYVLFLSSMPSILVEAGFLTNRDDAKLLRSDAYLDLLAHRVARGLVRYRDELPSRVARVGGVGR